MTPTAGSKGMLRDQSLVAVGDLLAAAREAFGSRGYDGVTTDDIAAATGRTKGAIYHHFPTKADLFEQVFIEEQRRLADVSATAGARRRDPVAAVKAGMRAYLGEVVQADVAQITLLDAPTVLGWQRWRACDGSPLRSLLVTGLEGIRAQDRFAGRHDLERLADLLMGAIGEAALRLAHEPGSSRLAQWSRALDQLIDGFTVAAPDEANELA
jgi:AcrR family transcriptional regulator